MKRFSVNELTASRIRDAVFRRFLDIPHLLAWHINAGFSKINKSYISSYKNKHIGQQCFIIGNGPSLLEMDMSPLKNEITFGLNRIYLLFDKLPFLPTYFVGINELVLEQFAFEIQALSMPKFLNWNQRNLFNQDDINTLFLRTSLNFRDTFQSNLTFPLSGGGTVTFVAMQIAYYMGFNKVTLIGLDHNFVDKGIPNKTEIRKKAQDENHFHPEYFPKGSRWQLPDLKRSELAYQLARETYEKDGRRILDATINGKCTVFEKVDYLSLF